MLNEDIALQYKYKGCYNKNGSKNKKNHEILGMPICR